MIWIDWLIIALVGIAIALAVYIMIDSKRKGKSLDCGNCPLRANCQKNKDNCKKPKVEK